MNTEFDTAVEQIFRIDRIIRQLDESIRPLAFQILARAAASADTPAAAVIPLALRPQPPLPLAGLPAFAERHAGDTPAQNMLALAAWIHLHDDDNPITPQKIKALAEVCGLSVPRRPDCTLRYASHHNHRLFQRQGYGWLLTPYGRAYVRQTFDMGGIPASAGA